MKINVKGLKIPTLAKKIKANNLKSIQAMY